MGAKESGPQIRDLSFHAINVIAEAFAELAIAARLRARVVTVMPSARWPNYAEFRIMPHGTTNEQQCPASAMRCSA